MQPGLYEQLVTLALNQELDELADSRLFAIAPIDPEDSHAAIAQFLEHVLSTCLATYRGKTSAEKQKRLADRIIATLVAELGEDWAEQWTLTTPLKRLLSIHAAPCDLPPNRPDTPLSRSALLLEHALIPALEANSEKK